MTYDDERWMGLFKIYGEDLDLWKAYLKKEYTFELDHSPYLENDVLISEWDASLTPVYSYWGFRPSLYVSGLTPDEAIKTLIEDCAQYCIDHAHEIRDREIRLAKEKEEQQDLDENRTLVISYSEFQEILRNGREYDSDVQIIKVVEDGITVMSFYLTSDA